MRIDPAMEGGHAQRAADVGPKREWSVACRERRRRAARRATRRAAEIERIVRRAVDLVVALPIRQAHGDVGLAEDDATGLLDPGDRQRVLRRLEIFLRRPAPGRGQAGDVVGFFHSDGETEQRLSLAARQCGVCLACGVQRTVEIPDADRVDLAVVPFDAVDRILRELDRGNLLGRQCRRQLDRALEAPFGFGHPASPVLSVEQ
ncbi:hypothetical protein ACVWXM_002884 [Bradyrhizobium sp. GM7.3]